MIFDCDGVLVDSEPLSTSVLAACLTAAGVATSAPEALERYRGKLLTEVGARRRAATGPTRCPTDSSATTSASARRRFATSLQPIAGARETVQAVIAAGAAVCVASQGKRAKTELTLTLTGLRDLFGADALFSADDVRARQAASGPVPARGRGDGRRRRSGPRSSRTPRSG